MTAWDVALPGGATCLMQAVRRQVIVACLVQEVGEHVGTFYVPV